MIKDTSQKIKAIRYCVALGLIPHLEVVVRFIGDTSDSPSNLTDIDVLGIKPCAESSSARVIFDCKTLEKMSPINRAIWTKGLMEITHSSEAFVILSKPAIEAHRLAGNSFGVKLFSEQIFDHYASASSADYLIPNSYLENIDGWNKLAEIPKKYPKLKEVVEFLNSTALLTQDGAQGVRHLIACMRTISGELDPSNAMHRMVFIMALSQFCIFVNEMVRDFHNIFDPQSDKTHFEKVLRYYIWGGRENYDLRQRLRVALNETKGVVESEPFEFPSWDKFVNYFRSCLDSPLALSSVCLPIKDIAFRQIVNPDLEIDQRVAKRMKTNNRVRQFSRASVVYFSDASKVPNEFSEGFSKELNYFLDTVK